MDEVVGGGKNRRLMVQAARGSLQARPKRRAFTVARRQAFLNYFAATCNAKGAARAAKVASSTVFAWRIKNAAFRAAFEEALGQGYVRLEAALVLEAEKALAANGGKGPAVAIVGMDAKAALAVLEAYRRNRGARPGDVLPRASDVEQVRARLEAKMRRLRIVDDEGRLIGPAADSPTPGPSPDGEGRAA